MSRTGVIFRENYQRKVIVPDKFNEHYGRFDCPTFRCRHNNEIGWFNRLTEIAGCCFNAQTKQGIRLGNKYKRGSNSDKQQLIIQRINHISVTLSDSQLGQMGFLFGLI